MGVNLLTDKKILIMKWKMHLTRKKLMVMKLMNVNKQTELKQSILATQLKIIYKAENFRCQ